jgi:hypothetical protein
MELSKLSQHMTQWKEIDQEARLLEDPPEETLSILRRLWATTILLWLNFYIAPDGKVYQLPPFSRFMWWRLSKNRIHYNPRNAAETLNDLDDELFKNIKRLGQVYNSKENQQTADDEVKEENQKLLRMVHASNGSASFALLLRFCVVSTPTRFATGIRLISEFYARKTSRLVRFCALNWSKVLMKYVRRNGLQEIGLRSP